MEGTRARTVLNPRTLERTGTVSGDVACALLTSKGNIFLGVCLDISCGIGFCAEHTAIANAFTYGKSRFLPTCFKYLQERLGL
jgi:cytidine deaminase